MSDDNAKYASDQYELAAMDLIDEVTRHPLRKSGEAGGVLVSEFLFMCLETYKRKYGGMDVDHTLNAIHDLPLASMLDYDPAEWCILTKEEWLGALIDGSLRYVEIEPMSGA